MKSDFKEFVEVGKQLVQIDQELGLTSLKHDAHLSLEDFMNNKKPADNNAQKKTGNKRVTMSGGGNLEQTPPKRGRKSLQVQSPDGLRQNSNSNSYSGKETRKR